MNWNWNWTLSFISHLKNPSISQGTLKFQLRRQRKWTWILLIWEFKKIYYILVLSFSSQIPTNHIYEYIKRSYCLLKHEGYLTAA